MKKLWWLNILFFVFGCDTKTVAPKNANHVTLNLYTNTNATQYYFSYSVPKRSFTNGKEEISSHAVLDSTVLLNDSIIPINSILDVKSYAYDSTTGYYQDQHFVYTPRDIQVVPKFMAIKK